MPQKCVDSPVYRHPDATQDYYDKISNPNTRRKIRQEQQRLTAEKWTRHGFDGAPVHPWTAYLSLYNNNNEGAH